MASDDSFQLYDLRVEVVCPAGAKILCGAKEGDYFTLQGEMLCLPPAQGISIYSLGALKFPDMTGSTGSYLFCSGGPSSTSCEAAQNTPE